MQNAELSPCQWLLSHAPSSIDVLCMGAGRVQACFARWQEILRSILFVLAQVFAVQDLLCYTHCSVSLQHGVCWRKPSVGLVCRQYVAEVCDALP